MYSQFIQIVIVEV